MGLFQHKQTQKKSPKEQAIDTEEHFFDEYFREELRNHGRWYFEKVIKEDGDLFKKDLDGTIAQVKVDLKEHLTKELDDTIAQVNAYLKEHVTKQLDEQLSAYSKALKDAQDEALESLKGSAEDLKKQHEELSTTLQKSVANQEVMLNTLFQENMNRMTAMKDAQDVALQSLNRSAQELEEQHKKLSSTLEENVAKQEEVLVSEFEGNMAQIIEHYLLDSLGDQYDLKAQLPSIIQQMESNKKAIVDDMKL